MCKVTGSDRYYVNLIPMNQEHIKSYYTINGLCLFIVCVILTPDHPRVRYSSTIDDGFLTDEESPNSEQMVQPRTVADKDILTVSDRKDNCRGRTWTGSDEDISEEIVRPTGHGVGDGMGRK